MMIPTAWTYSMDLIPSGVVAANATPAGLALAIALAVSAAILVCLAVVARRRERGGRPTPRHSEWASSHPRESAEAA